MFSKFAELACQLDSAGLFQEADVLDEMLSVQAAFKQKRSEFAIPADHPKNRSDIGHFPINTLARARNALARASQFSPGNPPKWWVGTSQALVNIITKAVNKKYPSITISDAGKKAGKG